MHGGGVYYDSLLYTSVLNMSYSNITKNYAVGGGGIKFMKMPMYYGFAAYVGNNSVADYGYSAYLSYFSILIIFI